MSYLFVDKWADFSDLNENNRGNVDNPIFLQYASVLRAHNKKVYYINTNDNKITQTKLLNFVEVEKIKTVIFHADIDNVSAISHLELLSAAKEIDLILFSINEDLIHFAEKHKKQKFKSIMFNERISLQDNLFVFLKTLNIVADFESIEKYMIDYSLVKDFRKKTAVINIGTGCTAKCSFCNIATSELKYRSIDVIMREINSLLSIGVKYFHVANHSFSCDRQFMRDFCTGLRDMALNYDFAWSCFIIPSFFIDNIDLLPLMAKSNLKKIEMGCESGSEILLSEMNIKHTNTDIEKIITASIAENIHVFSAHFIIGTIKENSKSLTETRNFILKLLDVTIAFCDIHLHCYFPENICFENIFDEITNKRNDFVCESETLTMEELNDHRKQMYIAIKSKKDELKSKIGLQKQHELFVLGKKYNIVSQMERDYFSKTRNYSLFAHKETHEHVFYSWEIPDKTFDYSLVYNNFGTFVPPEELNADYSNFHTVLDNYIRCGYTKKEIIEFINQETNGNVKEETVCSMLEQLENQFGLYYIKYLN